MKYQSVKFIVTFFAVLCLSIAAPAATKQEMGVVINLAGKQRMLTQKMSKEVLLIAKGIDMEANKANLKATADLFDRTLAGLINGDSGLGLIKTESTAIVQQLNTVADLWKTFRQNVDAVLAGDTGMGILEKIATQNMPLLKEMNKAVGMYEQESGSSLSAGMATTLNLAGKQRMLTQKMTKELLLVAMSISLTDNQANLKTTVTLFEKTLTGLLAGDAGLGLPGNANLGLLATTEKDIQAQLMVVKTQWAAYKAILDKSEVAQDDLAKAAQINVPLLKEMNKAVQMYAGAVK